MNRHISYAKFLLLVDAVISVSIIILFWLFYVNQNKFDRTSFSVKHTHHVIEQAQKVSLASKEFQIEAGEILLRKTIDKGAQPAVGRSQINAELQVLRNLIKDNDSQKARINILSVKIDSLMQFVYSWIDVTNTRKLTEAEFGTFARERDVIRQDIDSDIAAIIDEENALLVLRDEANRESISRNMNYYLAAGVFMIALLATSYLATKHHFRRRKKAEEAARLQESRFRLFIDGLKDVAILMVDPDGKIISWHDGASRLKGYTKEEVLGKHISIFYTPDALERGEPATNLAHARDNGSFETEGWRVKKDGSVFWADILITAIYNDDNELEGYLKVTRDYTLQQRVHEERQRALDKERELNEMKSNFVSMASHEFRSPLTTIRSSVSLIEKYIEINDAQKAQKHIQRVKSSVTELLEILEDFLSLEKIEQGKVEIRKEMVNVKEIVGQHCNKLESLLKTGQKIEYNHNGEDDTNTDTRALWHILTNLVSNASKYSPANSSISVSTNLYGHVLTLSVKDNGIGMSRDDQKHLFNRFFRASNAESIKGTGLGLHIVKRYVDLQGGQITVDSELDSGSMFTVTLNSA